MSRRTKTRTATRLCASCGDPFTWSSRNPRRRFCNPACKSRWWRVSNNDTQATGRPAADTTGSTTGRHDDTTNVVDPAATGDAVTPSYDPYVAGYGTGQAPNAIQNCPTATNRSRSSTCSSHPQPRTSTRRHDP